MITMAVLRVFLLLSVLLHGQEYRYPVTVCEIDPLLGAVTVQSEMSGCFDSGKQTGNTVNYFVTVDNVDTVDTVDTVECKNKNSNKDNTSKECNAGQGQEKNGG